MSQVYVKMGRPEKCAVIFNFAGEDYTKAHALKQYEIVRETSNDFLPEIDEDCILVVPNLVHKKDEASTLAVL